MVSLDLFETQIIDMSIMFQKAACCDMDVVAWWTANGSLSLTWLLRCCQRLSYCPVTLYRKFRVT